MSKKHKKKSSKKDDASDTKKNEKTEVGSNHAKDHPSQSLDDPARFTKAQNSLEFKEATPTGLQKNVSKETQHTGGILMSPEQREKIIIHFKNKVEHGGKRSDMDSASTSLSKEDSDMNVCDIQRKKKESQDLRILNSRKKKKKKNKAEHTNLKDINVRNMLPTECSFLHKKPLTLNEYSVKQNTSKEPYPLTSAFNFSGSKLHTQACREKTLEKAGQASLEYPSEKDSEMRCKPLCPVAELSKVWKYKDEEQLDNDSTRNVYCLRTHGSKYEPVTFQKNQSAETSRHSFSALEATGYADEDQEMQILEDLHAARIDKRMALPVVEMCGELTSMEIDLPDDESNKFSKSVAGLNTLIVVDTNIMIRHLEFIKSLKNSNIPGIGSFALVIPWVVLQELDNLKRGKILANVGQKAIPAVHFIYMCLKNQDPKLWGQSMQLASQKTRDFIVENNDDRVLQCCLQYSSLFPQAEVVLLTDDKNLCNKALVSEIKACSKVDLVTALQKLVPKTVVTSQDAFSGQSHQGKDTKCHTDTDTRCHKPGDSSTDHFSAITLDTKKCLGEALSSILETELKIVYGDLWTDVVYHKPPWTLTNVLECYRKHWVAVFGMVIPRSFFSTIEYLYTHLCKAKVIPDSTIKEVLQESKTLLEAFSSRSNYDGVLSQAVTQIDNLLEALEKLRTEPNSSYALKSTSGETSCEKMEDVTLIQNTQTGDNSLSPKSLVQGNRHMEIWSVLQTLWDRINEFSLEVFQKLDPSAVTTTGNMTSFNEAFIDLQKLMSAVNEILSGIQKVLVPNSSIQDIWTLYNFLINAEVNSDTKFTAEELYECVSQEVYRDRLSIGCGQLVQLEHTIKQCYESVCLEIKNRGWL